MTLVTGMWSVWGFLVLLFLLLKVYVGRLNRDESDQIVLDDVFEHVKTENDQIIAKVARIETFARIEMWILIAATLCVVAYYVRDMLQQFQ